VFGFLNINKPKDMTSHDVVNILRKLTKERQIGHSGTLDPFATGVLPIAVGKATRLIEYLEDDKEYLAEVSFGKNTDTYDSEGQITFESNIKITEQDVLNELNNFQGDIEQYPPIYSAIKVKGKKLYEYARNGQSVEIKPRKITIYKIELKSFDYNKQKAEILISCSKGTYIRSIAYDLGKILNCGAYLSGLIRTKAGSFSIENSVQLENIDIENNLQPPPINLQKVTLSDIEYKKISVGQYIKNKQNLPDGDKIILTYNNNISAIAQVQNDIIKVIKVFNL
jgi:tRNA pseudouridine55 synthase